MNNVFDLDEPYDEYDEFDDAMDDNDSDKLAHLVLRHFFDGDGASMINIEDEQMSRIVYNYFVMWAHDEIDTSNISSSEKKKLKRNQGAFLEYFAKNINEPPAIALNLLIFSKVPKSFHMNMEFIANLWLMSNKYFKNSDNNEDDWLAIVRINKYIHKLFEKINRKEMVLVMPEFKKIMMFSFKQIGDVHYLLKNYKESIYYYKTKLLFSLKNNLDDKKIVETTIVDIISVYEEYDKIAAINFISKILNNDLTELSIKEYCFIDSFRGFLEMKLIEIHFDVNIQIDESIVNTAAGIELVNIINDVRDNNNISETKIKRWNQLRFKVDEEIGNYLQIKKSNKNRYKDLLFRLDLFAEDNTDFENIVLELVELKEYVKNKEDKLLISLYYAKLLYVKNDKTSFQHYLNLSDSINNFETGILKLDWICEKIMATSLVIGDNPTANLSHISDDVKTAISIIDYITSASNDGYFSVKQMIQGEYEKLYFAIISVIEALYYDRTVYLGDATPPVEELNKYKASEKIIQILLNVVLHKINSLDNINIGLNNSNEYKAHNLKYSSIIYDYYTESASEIEINEISNNFSEFDLSQKIERNIELNYLPNVRSVFYLPVTKQNNKHKTIILSYNPIGHDLQNNLKFHYTVIDSVDIDKQITDIRSDYSNYNSSEMTIDSEKANSFTKQLVKPFNNNASHIFHIFKPSGYDNNISLNLSVYLDGKLNDIPIENLNSHEKIPLGVQFSISHFAHKVNIDDNIDFNRPVMLITDIKTWKTKNFPEIDTKMEQQAIETILLNNKLSTISLTQENATVMSFKKSLKECNPSILHFATHGLYDHHLPFDSTGIMLSEPEFLSFRDVINLDLSKVNLVVLSICNGSTISTKNDKNIHGIAQALLISGAKNVIASNVKVSNNFTGIFMTKFYELLIENSVADALRLTRAYFHFNDYKDFFRNMDDQLNHNDYIVELRAFVSSWKLWT